MRPRARRELAALRQLWVRWPEEYQQPGAHWAADQLLSGLRQVGVPVEVAHVDQPPEVVVFELLVEGRPELVAFVAADACSSNHRSSSRAAAASCAALVSKTTRRLLKPARLSRAGIMAEITH